MKRSWRTCPRNYLRSRPPRNRTCTTPTNIWYGAIGAEVRLQQQGPHFIGFFTLACALVAVGVWAFRRIPESNGELLKASVWVPIAAVLGVLFIALSFGKDVVVSGETVGPGPYRILFDYVPGFQLIRAPDGWVSSR